MTPASARAGRYFRQAALALAGYGVLVVAVLVWARTTRGPSWVLVAASLAPGAPVLAAVVATGRYLAEEADAVQRAIQLEALTWALGVTFGLATVWGLLQPLAGAPGVPSYCAFAVFSSVVASVQLARRRFPRRGSRTP